MVICKLLTNLDAIGGLELPLWSVQHVQRYVDDHITEKGCRLYHGDRQRDPNVIHRNEYDQQLNAHKVMKTINIT